MLLGSCNGASEFVTDLIQQRVVTTFSVDFKGYPGPVCIDTIGCKSQAELTSVSLPPGTFRVFAPYQRDATGSQTLGTVVVSPDGERSVTSEGRALDATDPNGIVLRTITVTLDHADYPGPLWLWNIATLPGPSHTVQLLPNRSYWMQDGYSRDPFATSESKFSTTPTFTVNDDGTAPPSVEVSVEGARYFTASGTTLKAITVPVTIHHGGYPGLLKLWGIKLTSPPFETIALIPNRSYWMQDPWSWKPTEPKDMFALAATFTVKQEGTSPPTVEVGTESQKIFTASGSTLRTVTVPVKIDHGAYAGPLWLWGITVVMPPTQTIPLLPDRRYWMQDGNSRRLTDLSEQRFSTAPTFTVSHDGSSQVLVEVGAESTKSFTASGNALKPITMPVNMDLGGYAGALGVSGVKTFSVADPIAHLIPGRAYRLVDAASTSPDGHESFLSDGFDFHVIRDASDRVDVVGTAANTVSDGVINALDPQGPTVHAYTYALVATGQGISGSLCLDRVGVCRAQGVSLMAPVLVARGYALNQGGAFSSHPRGNAAGACSPASLTAAGGTVELRCTETAWSGPVTSCVGRADGTVCDDGDACTLAERCSAGTCVGRPGFCTPNLVDCASANSEGKACDDGSACTTGDRCASGVCGGASASPDPICAIEPTLACVLPLDDGSYRAVFGYSNSSTPRSNLNIPPGTNESTTYKRNYLSSGQVAPNQPSWLESGTHPAVFTVDLPAGGSVAWHLGGKSISAQGRPTPGCTTTEGADGKAVTIAGTDYLLSPDPAKIAAAAKVATTGALAPLAGQGDVNPDGSYSYSIPIWAPPGINGLQPSLSLDYNSRGGNGIVGVGWSLSGFSTITRCPKTKRVSGEVSPVTYAAETTTEQYCLDGNPLVKSDQEDVFRTRSETFAKVRRLGTGTDMRWVAFTKDGRILSFSAEGALTGRQPPIGATGPPVAPAWWLESVQDRFGNKMQFEYETSHGLDSEEAAYTIERHPSKITYGGTSPTREIVFKYRGRQPHDFIETYVSGVRYVTTKLLSAVEVRVKDEAGTWSSAKEIRLDYHDNAENSGSDWDNLAGRKSITGRALLETVQECESAGSAAACTPATTFDWESGSWEFDRHTLDLPAGTVLSFADVDEDGRDDMILGVLSQNICPPGGGLPSTTVNGRASFEQACSFYRFPGGQGYYATNYNIDRISDPWRICDERKNEACGRSDSEDKCECGEAGVGGTALCDVYKFKGTCYFYEPTHKWAKYSFVLNTSGIVAGAWKPSFGAKSTLLDYYFISHAKTAAGIRAPVVINMDHSGSPEVITQEFQQQTDPIWFDHNLEQDTRYNLQVWPLGATSEAQVKFHDSVGVAAHKASYSPIPNMPLSISIGDIGGDGLQKLFYARGGERGDEAWSWTVAKLNPAGQWLKSRHGAVATSWEDGEAESATLMDVDGDGDSEVITWFNDGTAGSSAYEFPKALNRSPTFADFNGDGLIDALDRGKTDAPDKHIIINSGLRAAKKIKLAAPVEQHVRYLDPLAKNLDDGVRAGDFDGDGNTDVFLSGSGSEGHLGLPTLLLKKGNSLRVVNLNALKKGGLGFSVPDSEVVNEHLRHKGEQGIVGWREVYVLDFDGDGLMDVVQREGNLGMMLYRRKGPQPDLLKSVNRGLGAQTTTRIAYAPISDSAANVYTPVDCASPQGVPCNTEAQINVKTGMWVVKKLTYDAGTNGTETNSTSYKYFDGRTDRISGSFLGFRTFTATDDRKGSYKTTEFLFGSINDASVKPEQTPGYGFVLAGQPREERVVVPGINGINETTVSYSYEFVTFVDGKTGLVRPTKTTQLVSNPRQSACFGPVSEVDKVFTYVSTGAGAQTSEIKREFTEKRPGAGCASQGRTLVTERLTKDFTYWPDDTALWLLGRQKDVTSRVEVDEQVGEEKVTKSVTKATRTEWHPSAPVPKKTIQLPTEGDATQDADERLETVYEYVSVLRTHGDAQISVL